MSKIDDQTRLRHMLDAAQKVVQYVENETQDTLERDEKLALALVS